MAGSNPGIVVRLAADSANVDQVRALLREYGDHLAAHPSGAANICISGYESELAALPGVYARPGALLVALVDGEPAGCVALKLLGHIRVAAEAAGAARDGRSSRLELKRLWVRPGFRGLGLGRRLVQAAIDYARATAAVAIYLDTVPAAMPEANLLYASMGFRQIERYNDNPVADIVFFELRLEAVDGAPHGTQGASEDLDGHD